jgi:transporter family-2 protein
LGAVSTGLAIGAQSTLSSRVGLLIGPFRTGMLTNLFGGMMAGLIVLYFVLQQGLTEWLIPRRALTMLLISGALGILIIMGISFSLSRTGITAGLAAIILGQLFISVIVDTTGWGGVEPIPLSYARLFGLAVMGVAIFFLLPRN